MQCRDARVGAAGQRAVIKATFAMSAVRQQPAVSSTCRLGSEYLCIASFTEDARFWLICL